MQLQGAHERLHERHEDGVRDPHVLAGHAAAVRRLCFAELQKHGVRGGEQAVRQQQVADAQPHELRGAQQPQEPDTDGNRKHRLPVLQGH